MKGSVVRQVILKDLRMQRMVVVFSLAGGAAALGLVQIKSELPVVLGSIWFFLALILLGCFLPANILNERKKQNIAFLMSLPLSAMQYTLAKMLSTFGMFLIPWLILVVGALSLVASHSVVPHGIIPLALVLSGITLVGFCLISAVAIVCETEGSVIAATVICNSAYGLSWYLLVRIPAVNHDLSSPAAVWSPIMLRILTVEFLLVVFTLALTFFLQSRKKDFI